MTPISESALAMGCRCITTLMRRPRRSREDEEKKLHRLLRSKGHEEAGDEQIEQRPREQAFQAKLINWS